MANRSMLSLLALVLMLSYGVMTMASNIDEDWGMDQRGEEEWDEHHQHHDHHHDHHQNHKFFLLQQSKTLVKSQAGEMSVVKSVGQNMVDRHINVGFLTLEANSLFTPHYMDSSVIIFVQSGQGSMGLIQHHELKERQLKAGDLHRIPAGATFYLQNVNHQHHNAEQHERLEIILSVDSSKSLRMGTLENFFLGGGTKTKSVLHGFSSSVLTSAFNVSSSELKEVLSSHQGGRIVHVQNSHSSSNPWSKFVTMNEEDKLEELKKLVDLTEEEPEKTITSSWRRLMSSLFGPVENEKKNQNEDQEDQSSSSHHQHSHNLYNRKPTFQNQHGWTLSVDQSNFSPLKHTGIGAHLLSLKAGSMLAPHVNPSATEYGVVTKGSGSLQVVYPNGTLAMKAHLKTGSVYWVPRYFPFVQVASQNEHLEIFGFSTSPQHNQPQFLAGSSSVLKALKGQQLATAFGVSEGSLNRFVNAQSEAVILAYHSQSSH